MIKISALILFISYSFNTFSYPLTPDPEMTSGELCSEEDPDFSSYRYEEGIPYCERDVSGWRKEQIYELYNIPEKCRDHYTIDHFIPLAVGGDNSDVNLWPEHVLVKATRPDLELDLYYALANGELTQKEAIEIVIKEKMSHKQRLKSLQNIYKDCHTPEKELHASF